MRRLSGDYDGNEYLKSLRDEEKMENVLPKIGRPKKGIRYGVSGRDLASTSHGRKMKERYGLT